MRESNIRQSLFVVIVSVSIAVAGGCNRGGRHVKEQRIPDSARARLDAGPTMHKLNVVPSQGTCAPKADNLAVFGSCYNNVACSGQFVKDDAGQIGCACFDVKGGCQEGLVCSKIRRGCVAPLDAQLP
jgi:hypothetical protein